MALTTTLLAPHALPATIAALAVLGALGWAAAWILSPTSSDPRRDLPSRHPSGAGSRRTAPGAGLHASSGAHAAPLRRTFLEHALEANAAFLATHPEEPPPPDRPRLCCAVVACMDARLTDLLPRALGIGRGDAAMIRTAGHAVFEHDQGVLRSLAVACRFQGVREVAVVGHTGCGMRRRPQEVRAAGLDPNWLGSFEGTIEDHVRSSVATIARCADLPEGVSVYGLVIDTHSGALSRVCASTTAGVTAEVATAAGARAAGAAGSAEPRRGPALPAPPRGPAGRPVARS